MRPMDWNCQSMEIDNLVMCGQSKPYINLRVPMATPTIKSHTKRPTSSVINQLTDVLSINCNISLHKPTYLRFAYRIN